MANKQQPRLMAGGLSGKIYVTTRYRENKGTGQILSSTKYDVSEDFWRLVRSLFPDQDIDEIRSKL